MVWLHFSRFSCTQKLRESCWFVGICPAPQNRNTHSHIHTWRHKVIRLFPRFVCCWFIHQDHHPTKDFFFFWESPIDRCFFHPSAGSHISGLVTCKKGSTSSDLRVPANGKCCWTISLGWNAFPNWEFRSPRVSYRLTREREQGKINL